MSEDKDKYSVSIVKMSSYVRPEITQEAKANEDWIRYGEKNDYFDYVNDRYYGSPTNNAIINGIAELIYGGGLRVDGGSDIDQEKLDAMFDEDSVARIAHDFKRQGNAAFEVLKLKGGGFTINHVPVETLRAQEVDDKGNIQGFWFCSDWKKYDKTRDPNLKPTFIDAFNEKAAKSIVYVKNYQPNTFYYSPPDYQGAIPYAELEEEIANYHINNIKNSFVPSSVINYNNGVPGPDERNLIEKKTNEKFTGSSNAGRLLIAFNDSKENAVTMESYQLNDAHNQYEFLSEEARKQLMVGHRITSPRLLGISDGGGLGNNADEIETASRMLDATVIRPKQNILIKEFTKVLQAFGIDIEIFFENLQPLSVSTDNQEQAPTATANEIAQPQQQEQPQAMSADIDLEKFAKPLLSRGEKEDDILNDYELFDVAWAEDDERNIEQILNGFVNFGANDKSSQDGELFKVRYMYKETSKSKPQNAESRPLCSTLMGAQLIYRKEDILDINSDGGAEAQGQSYNVFLHKGGVNCQHGWERRIFRKRLKKDGTAWGGGAMNGVTRAQLYDAIRGDAKISQSADKKAYTAPRDTPSKGHK